MVRNLVWVGLLMLWATSAGAQPSDDEAARQHFNAGKAYFERAEYDDALKEFEEAYALSGRTALLINISRAHESAGRLSEAAAVLEQWKQAAASDDPLHSDVDSRLRRLRAQADKAAAEASPARRQAEPSSAPAEAAPPEAAPSRLGPWLLVGTGAAVLGAGVVFFVLGRMDISDVENPEKDARWADVEAQHDRAPLRVGLGVALAGVGAVALGAGLVWHFRQPGSSVDRQARLEAGPYGVRVQGRF